MKRPRAFILVVLWFSLALLIQVSYLTRPVTTSHAAGETIPEIWYYLPFVALCFGIWQIVGLVQLKRFNRWFAVVFFLWWTATMFWRYAVSAPLASPGRILLFLSMAAILNLVSAWYIARRSFREFAVQYVSEKHSRLMRMAAQKRTLADIKSNRRG